MPYNRLQAEEADMSAEEYLDEIIQFFRPSPQANTMQPESNPIMFDSPINAEPAWTQELRAKDSNPVRLQELRANDKIYGNSEDFNPKSGEILSNIVSPAPAIQPQAPVIPQQPARDTLMRFQSRNINPPREEAPPVMAPIPAQAPPIETKAAPAQEVSQVPAEAQKPDESIFNSISNTLKDVSKSASDTFNDPAFRQGLGGILVAIGAGFQGQDASKSLERYHNSILNDKQEARRKALEEEQRVKKDPNSVWNLTYREMIKKTLPGVEKMLGADTFEKMTAEDIKTNYPVISGSMAKMTEKELSNPGSASSIDAVKSYNEMISSFGGKIKLLEEGKYSAKDVDKFMSNLNNVIQYNHQEDQKDFNKSKLSEDIRQFDERQKQEQAFKKEDLGIKKAQLSAEIADQNRRYGLEVNKFNYNKQKDAKMNELMKQKMENQLVNKGMSEKEARKLAIDYPFGIVLSMQERNEISKKNTGYNKMKIALDDLEKGVKTYGASMNPSSDGYKKIDALWSEYMLALKDARELGALDKGVEGAAEKTLMNPTKMNVALRFKGGEEEVKREFLSILNDKKRAYREQYVRNTSMYGYNPEIGSIKNTEMMDKLIDPNTPDSEQKAIINEYAKMGYNKDTLRTYTENYQIRRKPLLGVR